MLSIVTLVLGLLQGLIPMFTKANAPAEVIADLQAALTAIQNVHGTLVTKAQIDSLLVEPKW